MVANSLLWIAIPQRLGHIFAAEKRFAMFATHGPDVTEFFVFKNLNVRMHIIMMFILALLSARVLKLNTIQYMFSVVVAACQRAPSER